MKRALKPLPPVHGAQPAAFGFAEASAVQALYHGKADEGQQKAALKWILEGACAVQVWPYRTDQRETDIGLGRHFVGHQIMGIIKVNLSQLRKNEEKLNG